MIPFETDERLINEIKTNDELEINIEDSTLKNITSSKIYKLKSLGDVWSIIEAGGLFSYAKRKGFIKK